MATKLRNLQLDRIDLVDLGAGIDKRGTGDAPRVLLMKRAGAVDKAEWDAAYINALPDSAFAYVEPGGDTDADGKTTPRALRHLPYKNSSGAVDLPHLRNALSRLPQTNLSAAAKASAERKLNAAAKEAGVGDAAAKRHSAADTTAMIADLVKRLPRVQKEMYLDGAAGAPASFDEVMLTRTLSEVTDALNQDVWALYDSLCQILRSDATDKGTRLKDSLGQFLQAVTEELADWTDDATGDVTKAGRKISGARMKMLKDMHAMLGDMIQGAEYAKGGAATAPAPEAPQAQDDEAPNNKETDMPAGTPVKADKASVEKHVLEALAELGIAEPTVEQVEKMQARLPRAAVKPATAEDVLKAMDPAVRAYVDGIQKRAEAAEAKAGEAETIAKAERESRVRSEYISKAGAFNLLGMKADDDWMVLREVDERLTPDVSKRVKELLRGAVAKIKAGTLFGERGQGGDASAAGSAVAEVERRATALMGDVAKHVNGKPLTREAAITKVFEEDRELYEQYRTETQVKVSPGKS